jgi:hypothetical protein
MNPETYLNLICTRHPDIQQMAWISYDTSCVHLAAKDRPSDVLMATIDLTKNAQVPETHTTFKDFCIHVLRHPENHDVFMAAQYSRKTTVVKSLKRLLRRSFRRIAAFSPLERAS